MLSFSTVRMKTSRILQKRTLSLFASSVPLSYHFISFFHPLHSQPTKTKLKITGTKFTRQNWCLMTILLSPSLSRAPRPQERDSAECQGSRAEALTALQKCKQRRLPHTAGKMAPEAKASRPPPKWFSISEPLHHPRRLYAT